MILECPNCRFAGSAPDDKIPEDGITVTCPKCQSRFQVEKDTSINSTVNRPQDSQMSCPKCGTDQPASDICVNCGIVFAKLAFRKPDERVESQGSKLTAPEETASDGKNDVKQGLQSKKKGLLEKLKIAFLAYCGVTCAIFVIVGFYSGEPVIVTVFLIPIVTYVAIRAISKSEKATKSVTAAGRQLIHILGVLIVIGFIVMIIDKTNKGLNRVDASNASKKGTSLFGYKERGYYSACQDMLKNGGSGVRLKAPATAKFQPFSEIKDKIVTDDNGMVALYFYVDSQNTFGAMMRDDCSCVVNGNTGTVLSVN